MAASFPLNATGTGLLAQAYESISKNTTYDDYILLPLVILGTSYVLNRGSILPKKDPYSYVWFQRPQAAMGMTSQTVQRSRNIADVIRENNSDIVVIWGSQSGTAEAFAHRFAREAHQRYKLNAYCADLSEYDAESITSIPSATLAVFIMSTYGEGDPSDNAQEFVTWSKSAKVDLSHIKFAAFGCGNSNYRYFNKIINDVAATLSRLGATSITPIGRGNEATRTTEEDFVDWKETLFSTLASERGLTEVEATYEPEVNVIHDRSIPQDRLQLGNPFNKAHSKTAVAQHTEIVAVPVVERTELARYTEHGRSCIQVTVDLTAHVQIKYKTGDHIAVWPENSAREVDTLINILGLQTRRSESIHINPATGLEEPKVPSPTTIEALFQYYLEICSPVPRETVLALARMAPSAAIKSGLRAFSKDRETYATFLESSHLTFSRLCALGQSFDPSASWTCLPLSFVIDSLPAMQPRLYSISSSRIISPRHVTLTVSVKPSFVHGNTDASISGITSSFLAKTQASEHDIITRSKLQIQIRQSNFKLPINKVTPLVMVAAGTGIAPLRAFVHERARLASIGKEIGHMMLFFGCHNEIDYLYSDEFKELSAGPLAGKLELIPAFSRDGHKRVYVQDRVRQRCDAVLRLLCDEDAAFYICGAATMAKEVGNVLSEALRASKNLSDGQADRWRVERKRSKRWFEDVWS